MDAFLHKDRGVKSDPSLYDDKKPVEVAHDWRYMVPTRPESHLDLRSQLDLAPKRLESRLDLKFS